jgi:acyl-coenzyme A synthetase/AMP-(fatty) acid ligase
VKLRGQRIELGEVENNLRRAMPGAAELAVELITITNEYVASLLVAFICLGDAFEGDEESLENMSPMTRELLKQKVDGVPAKLARTLPSHMIPTIYVPLKSMPRTSAKKADRRELRRLVSGLTMIQLKGFSIM